MPGLVRGRTLCLNGERQRKGGYDRLGHVREIDFADDRRACSSCPLAEFTAARNALAGTTEEGGDRTEEAERVKALPKPSLSAWAVNQLYWHHREGVRSADRRGRAVPQGAGRATAPARTPTCAGRSMRAARRCRSLTRLAAGVLRDAGHNADPGHDAPRDDDARSARDLRRRIPDAPPAGTADRRRRPAGIRGAGGARAAGRPHEADRRRAEPRHPVPADDARAARRPRRRSAREEEARRREEEHKAQIAAAKAALAEAERALREAQQDGGAGRGGAEEGRRAREGDRDRRRPRSRSASRKPPRRPTRRARKRAASRRRPKKRRRPSRTRSARWKRRRATSRNST